VRDYGVAIIILVLIVRALLHPITKKGQVNMVRMQHRMSELAPKIEEIKRKYANDKVRMNQEMMKLNINPAGQFLTCLPMFLQLPVWAGLWVSLSTNVLMRHEGFLFTWIRDLTVPDNLIPFSSAFVVPIFGWEIHGFNLLPILVTAAMYIQMKAQPKPKPNPNMTQQQREQQEAMQRMMPIMNVMMLLLFYNAPSGLNLYILSSSLIGALEQHVIRKHIKEREEAGTLHKPARPVDAKALEQRRDGQPGWFERLQKMADQAQKTQRMPKAKDRR
jgi:YidC/Oxa1 family membrane protein insertase